MPSPFPGMDPFLERPDRFPDLHHDLITFLKRNIQSQLPPPYSARTGERVWVELSQRFVSPNVSVERARQRGVRDESSASVVLLAPAGPVVVAVELVPDDEVREGFLEVYAREGETRRLVTAIEVLSPSNKSGSGAGRRLYQKKQQEILERDVHLVEIDLLRGGLHTTAVPNEPSVAVAGAFDYHVCVRRFDQPAKYFVYPIFLEQRLPTVAIPLLPGDPDVTVDLQALFETCYDGGPWRRDIDYRHETPVPPLRPEQGEWLRGVLEAAPNL